MRIAYPEETKQIDGYCDMLGLSVIALMENAATCLCKAVTNNFCTDKKVLAICGGGNNGADGLAALRKLNECGYKVKAYITGNMNKNVTLHKDILVKSGINVITDDIPVEDVINGCNIILDCLFGTGFREGFDEHTLNIIKAVNTSGKYVISADIPSGVDGSTGRVFEDAVKADITVVFGNVKPGNIIYPGKEYCGKIIICKIGIPDFITDMFTGNNEYLDYESINIKDIIKTRKKDSHKGDYGKVYVVAGSRGMTGAALLCAEAALRSGAGLCYIISPKALTTVYETVLREAVKIGIGEDNDSCFMNRHTEEVLNSIPDGSNVILGPGLGTNESTKKFVLNIVPEIINKKCKLILDADGINAFENKSYLLENKNIVITPHVIEMQRLTGKKLSGRIADTLNLAKNGLIVVLKGADTITACDSKFTINGTGNPGMATAGSGDVLAGIIGTLSTKMDLYDAARYGVYIHGLCGDYAKKKLGEESMLSGDLIKMIPEVLKMHE